ncbi:MAG: dipeptide/oligopeptide/nickel ABC transporter ATP-binding protein, partial [Christensenellaceae bacterium]|nr:dipeptide/oligopeptide/nickel ABC transporter ATP-binding protein [Christensenellaceae bacterium]
MSDVVLKVDNLSQHFKLGSGTLKAVDGVSFEVRKGEVLGIVGESGCGKTTVGRTVIGLYPPTGGSVYLNGTRISAGTKLLDKTARDYHEELAAIKADKKAEKKNKNTLKIQMIFQDPVSSLDPRLTVMDIIAEGLIIKGERNKEVIREKVYAVLEKVGLVKEHANRYPHEFSGGQRQRIGIARAVVMEPEVIIADEPVSALDVSIQAQVILLLNKLRNELGITIVFIAHDISVVKYFSDKI